jgi:AraC family transcriptional activator of tynA and feaB
MTKAQIFSTEDIPIRQRCEWLREVIGREYANVDITPPKEDRLFNEMMIYHSKELRLSSIRSNSICIERLPKEPTQNSHDAYFAVVLLSGEYLLEQDGREAVLRPGEMAIYDATRPHRIFCPGKFSKLIVSIPRATLRERFAGVEYCTATRVPAEAGIASVTTKFIRSFARHANELSAREFSALSGQCTDLLTLALAAPRGPFAPSRSRAMALSRVKDFVEQSLQDPKMDAATVARGVGMSSRYINDLFNDEGGSLMRYVWKRRLEKCRKDLLSEAGKGRSISEIAFRWGFNDLSHFSRSFRQTHGCAPRDYRRKNGCGVSLEETGVFGRLKPMALISN